MKISKTIKNKRWSILFGLFIVFIWFISAKLGWLPRFIIPSPEGIVKALISEWSILIHHSWITLQQAIIGLFFGVFLAFVLATLMDRSQIVYDTIYPFLIISQTIPTVAIAPILVLWFGYGMLPKIILVTLTTLFPLVINILEGFKAIDLDSIHLLKLMGANEWQILRHVKFPSSLPFFFSGLKISVSYAFVGSVIAEWLGGFEGLGVYMIRAKDAFLYANMFAAIVVISTISLFLIWIVEKIEHYTTPWTWKYSKEGTKHHEV